MQKERKFPIISQGDWRRVSKQMLLFINPIKELEK